MMGKEMKNFRVAIAFKFVALSPEDDKVTISGVRKLSTNSMKEAFDSVKQELVECYSDRGIFIEGDINLTEVV